MNNIKHILGTLDMMEGENGDVIMSKLAFNNLHLITNIHELSYDDRIDHVIVKNLVHVLGCENAHEVEEDLKYATIKNYRKTVKSV